MAVQNRGGWINVSSDESIVSAFIEKVVGKIDKVELGKKVERVREIAFREWSRWISGSYRPSSMGEITADRIFQIYSEVLEELPAVEDLVNYLSIPAGRARYIIGSLTYGGHPDLRRLARTKLKEILEEAIRSGRIDDEICPFIDKALLDELSIIDYELLHKLKNQDYKDYVKYQELAGRKSFGIECKMSVNSAKLIIKRLDELLKP
jgi:hypothetical protein